jgi:phosphoribosyl 1,2-cyclic phosphodiesterase
VHPESPFGFAASAGGAQPRGDHAVRLTFLGTRGEIEARSSLHRRHSSLLVDTSRGRVLIDCGRDWLGELEGLSPDIVLLTHAHEDHAGGLRDGAPCPVLAGEDTWAGIRQYPIERRSVLEAGVPLNVCGLRVEAVPVEHSLRAPAVGFRIGEGGVRLFYVPDVAAIPERTRALAAIDLYVGDGASLVRPILRRRDDSPIGHASIRDQLSWCAEQGVPRAIFTHCGSQLVRGDPKAMQSRVEELGADVGVEAALAYDGLELSLGDVV